MRKRFRLKQDYKYSHYEYTKGQTGWATIFDNDLDRDEILVRLDGYEEDKAKDDAMWRKYGEGANLVPWVGLFPPSILEFIDEDIKS